MSQHIQDVTEAAAAEIIVESAIHAREIAFSTREMLTSVTRSQALVIVAFAKRIQSDLEEAASLEDFGNDLRALINTLTEKDEA